jgi:small subunit ribosomal protein S17
MAKVLQGKVVSTKMMNTIVVEVERAFTHPLYKKTIRKHKKYKAHVDESMKVNEGDTVDIEETKPISKDKKFKVIAIK